jgi:outer membrane receptor protein involved in Fe transport
MKLMFLSYRTVCYMGIALGSLACDSAALGQTNNPPASTNITTSTNVIKLDTVTVVGQLNQARSQILPNLGATAYTINATQIESQSQGANAPFNQLILRAPGVAEDSAENGDLHVRGEHANLQYRIDDVLLPEGIAGFGLELDPRFVQSMQLITGSLPAQYGFRTAGVVDIQTKSGTFNPGGEVSFYGGSYDTFRPSFEYGGSEGKFNFFIDGSYDHNELGVENPTPDSTAIHDETEQFKTFMYGSYIIDPSSRLTLMASASYADYQVPNTPGVASGTAPSGATYASAMQADGVLPSGTFDSASDNENQNEENYYTVLTYQKSAGNLDFQVSAFGRESEQHFTPDPIGDLYLNGEASEVHRTLYSAGLQADASYQLGDYHTIRAGGSFLATGDQNNTSTTVFNLDSSGNPTTLTNITDDHPLYGLFMGVYLQDEWKLFPQLTLNYGARFDVFSSSFDDENQLSPRVNLIYKPTPSTTLHAGYSRYFTPPPVEDVGGGSLLKFANTSGAPATFQDDSVKAERANYFDAGVTQTIIPGLNMGLDGYFKTAQNQLDDGLFGQTLILSAFNYEKGRVYGLELTASYETNGFAAYANAAYSVARGENWNSAQFLFDPSDAVYVQNHWIYLDHDQTVSATGGVSYRFKEARDASTMTYLDIVYGSGLRQDGDGFEPGGNPIPNGSTVPQYYEINLGVEQTFQIAHKQFLKARLDVVNVTDNIYELRSASGVGVNAAQYGMRRGIFGTLSYRF